MEPGEKLKKIFDILFDSGETDDTAEQVTKSPQKPGAVQIKKLTLKEVSDYYYEMKRKYPQIRQCIISLEDVSRIGANFSFRLEQYFTDITGSPVYSDNVKRSLYGRVVLAENIDNELLKFLGGKTKVTLTL